MWVRVEPSDLVHRARMTGIQFAALQQHLDPTRVIKELRSLPYFQSFRKSAGCKPQEVKRWLMNGWNTEFLLRANSRALEGHALRNSLHWAFPQAYYSTFSLVTAFFKTAGFTEVSHQAVMRKVGSLMKQGKYPPVVAMLADGGKDRAFINISKCDIPHSTYFDPDDPAVCQTQICQFLNATREYDLDDKKKDLKFRTKADRPKRALNKGEWQQVSQRLGPTSILSLLYRKRIKSNYRDIDTYLSQHLDADNLYGALIRIVACMHFVHEAFILKGLGTDRYDRIASEVGRNGYAFLTARRRRLGAFVT